MCQRRKWVFTEKLIEQEMNMTGRTWVRAAAVVIGVAMVLGMQSPVSSQGPGQQPMQQREVEPTADVPMAEGWRKTTIVEGLEHPWGMAFLPDGRILITERPGRLRVVQDGQLVEQEIEGVPDVFAQGQGGLLDIALHPNFQQNQYVYLTYAAGTEQQNRTTLARGRLDGMRLRDVEVLFEAHPPKRQVQHFGSRIIWAKDGTLLMSIGDGGNPPLQIDGILARDHAQRLDTHLGSIIRLNDDGSVPQDNPLVGRQGARPEIWSYGHRNIQGIAADQQGRLWVTEHGPLGGDELNLAQRGENHGWPLATHGADYRTGQRFTEYRTLPGAVAPKVVWTPATAPSGLAYYTGERFPQWRGNLFSGGLVGQDIRRIILEGENVVGQETIPIAQRVRDVVQGPDGFLYVLTDEEDGELIRIEPDLHAGAMPAGAAGGTAAGAAERLILRDH
jgi:glucose/arabinose dehydrogenase